METTYEWLFSMRYCDCGSEPGYFMDTIRPHDNKDQISSAGFKHFTDENQEGSTFSFSVNGNVSAVHTYSDEHSGYVLMYWVPIWGYSIIYSFRNKYQDDGNVFLMGQWGVQHSPIEEVMTTKQFPFEGTGVDSDTLVFNFFEVTNVEP